MVTFVCGIPASGKSTYIRKNFHDTNILDILDFQKKQPVICVATVLQAQEEGMHALLEAAKKGDAVMEHTLLRKQRRLDQIEFLRNNGYDGEIHLVFLNPPLDALLERGKGRKADKDSILKNIETIELPTEDEPFTSIKIVGE